MVRTLSRPHRQRYIFLKFALRGGGGKKPALLVKIREENLYLIDFSYFTHENLVF